MSEENRALSDIVWTPERGLSEPEIRGISWNNFLLSDESYGGRWRTESEVRVTPETALQSTVVLACCRILAETISALPLHVYRRGEGGSKDIARDIPLYRVLSFAPNSWQTKFEFFEQMVMNLCLWGNSYTQIKSGRYGAVSELINLHPSRMDVERLENGRLRYMYTNPETGRLEPYTQDQIMHVRWTAEPDGIKGMVPVEVAREAIALARACEIHAAKFWANSARPGIVLQTDGSLSPEAAERLRDNWERLHRGADRAYKTAILTNGLKVEPVGFTAEQSQFESTRRFQSEEIARVYRLPVRLVQGQSGGNPEIEGQDFVTYTLVPWLRRIESAISRSLIYNDDLFVAEFDVRGLMRGDSNSRASYYSTMTNLGIFSINDCRRLENMPPLENGDKHFVGMNMQTLEDAVKPKPDPMAAPPGGPPPPAQGGVPSLPEVKTGKAPNEAEQGEKSEPKPKMEEATEEKRALSPQNQALYDAQEAIVKENGRWPQQGASGAHYMEQNPFASRGISCRNCIYYEEGGSCEIVKGVISPNAICKLWIIPEEKLSMPESRAFCPTGEGGGVDNSCGSKEKMAPDTGGGSGGLSPSSPTPKSSPTPRNASSVTREDVARLLEKMSSSPDGFSLDPLSSEQPSTGIMVSEFLNNSERSVKISSSDLGTDSGAEKFAEWLDKNSDLLLGDDTRFVGGWKAGDEFYIDVSTRFEPNQVNEALEAGREAGQLAVFNLETFKETWVKYDDGDPRKPSDYDGKFDEALSRNPDAVDELKQHGKNSVRSYTSSEGESQGEIHGRESRTVRNPGERKVESPRDVRGLSGVREEDGGSEGRGTVSWLVSGEAPGALGSQAGPLKGVRHRAAEALVRELRSTGDVDVPNVVFRPQAESRAVAEYDRDTDTIYVSESLTEEVAASFRLAAARGWLSQPNPLLHELAHRHHAIADADSYEASAPLEDEELRSVATRVSRYAATGSREFVAEVIAGSWAGKEYDSDVMSLLSRITNGAFSL